MYVTMCMPGSQGSQMVSGSLDLESQTVVHCHMGAGKHTWICWKSNQCS